MPTTKYRRRNEAPATFTAEERARILARDEAEILARAEADPDNPPLETHPLPLIEAAEIARVARKRSGLTQAKFAAVYKISLGRLRDIEQGRYAIDETVLAYLRTIAYDPETVKRAIEAA